MWQSCTLQSENMGVLRHWKVGHGGVFLSENAMKIYQVLSIHKEEIQSRQAWQNYIETAFNVQRRMADWHFEMSQTWEDLVAAHEKWIIDYNYQKHFAHCKWKEKVAAFGRNTCRFLPPIARKVALPITNPEEILAVIPNEEGIRCHHLGNMLLCLSPSSGHTT